MVKIEEFVNTSKVQRRHWRQYSDASRVIPYTRGPNHQFFGQISAQILSKIFNVWVKAWTKHFKKRVFATKPDLRQKRVDATKPMSRQKHAIATLVCIVIKSHIFVPLKLSKNSEYPYPNPSQQYKQWMHAPKCKKTASSPFLFQFDTFGKWLRCLTNVCYVNIKKLRYLDKLR